MTRHGKPVHVSTIKQELLLALALHGVVCHLAHCPSFLANRLGSNQASSIHEIPFINDFLLGTRSAYFEHGLCIALCEFMFLLSAFPDEADEFNACNLEISVFFPWAAVILHWLT